MSRNAMIAIIAGIIVAAAIAGVVAATAAPGAPPQQDNQTATSGSGKKITIDLNENLGLKENS